MIETLSNPDIFYSSPESSSWIIFLHFLALIITLVGVPTFTIIVIVPKIWNHLKEEDDTAKTRIGWAFMSIGLLMFSLWCGSMLTQVNSVELDKMEQVKTNQAALIQSCGITISESNMAALKFPLKKPEQDTQYGTIQGKYQGKTIAISLAWENGKMKLLGTTDNGQFQEICSS